MPREYGIDLRGYPKPAVLASLYNHSKPLGSAFGEFQPGDMSFEEAAEIIRTQGTLFHYLNGRVLHVDIGGDFLNPFQYNLNLGPGTAELAISAIKHLRVPPMEQPSPEITTELRTNIRATLMGVAVGLSGLMQQAGVADLGPRWSSILNPLDGGLKTSLPDGSEATTLREIVDALPVLLLMDIEGNTRYFTSELSRPLARQVLKVLRNFGVLEEIENSLEASPLVAALKSVESNLGDSFQR